MKRRIRKSIKKSVAFVIALVMCFVSLQNFSVYADENTDSNEKTQEQIDNTETDQKGETQQSEQESNTDDIQESTDNNASQTISVQTLENEASVQTDDFTDRVEYVDVNGNAIEGSPATIPLGNMSEHKELNISDTKHYEFKSAQVNGKNVVFIGEYNNTVYYSTDGVIAIKLEDEQKITMTYQEFYNITIKEDIPEGGVAGTITSNGNTVNTSKTVRVNAGDNWNVEIKPAVANKIRYKISSVQSDKNADITETIGNEYDANYTIHFKQDDTLTMTYSSDGVYHVHVKTTDNDGTECMNTDASHYTKGYVNDFTFTKADLGGTDMDTITLPEFHVISGKRIVSFQLNGHVMHDDTSYRDIPVSASNPITVRIGTGTGVFCIQIHLISLSGTKENDCSYGYQLTLKKVSGEWEDLDFVPTYENGEEPTSSFKLTEKGILNNTRQDNVIINHYLEEPDKNEPVLKDTSKQTISLLEVYEDESMLTTLSAYPGYVLDKEKSECKKKITLNENTGSFALDLYYKPTVLKIAMAKSASDIPDKEFDFVLKNIFANNVYLKKDQRVTKLMVKDSMSIFSLKNSGESIEIYCLPENKLYTLSENAGKMAYKIDNDEPKSICEFTMKEASKIDIINTQTVFIPTTGLEYNLQPWIVLVLIGGALFIIVKKTNNKQQ